jgi:hypothetical protein
VGIVCALGDFPHFDYYATSIHFHDVDYRVHEYGKRKALMVLPDYHRMVGHTIF